VDLFPYQEEGVRFLLSGSRRYLADEMGLGKTVQAVRAAHYADVQTTLVICPASVQENWKREWAAWGGPGELQVVSYSKLIRAPKCYEPAPFDLVICDEAHYLKSPGAQRTKATLRLAQRAHAVWLLSGTPVPNDVRELWSVFKALWPEYIPEGVTNAFKWMDHFCVWDQNEYGYRVWGNKPTVKTELRPALQRFMLRRRLRDIAMELPPLRVTVQHLDKDPTLAAELEALGALPEDEEHMSTLRRILGEYKAPRVARLLQDELQDGHDLVVLYHHKATGAALREGLGGHSHVFGFDGSTPAMLRQEQIDGFQQYGGLFLAQQTAAGTGITLTRASEIVLVEPAWTPSDNEQAIKRIHRIGQDQPCRARLFAVPDSLDEALMKALARKSVMVKEVVDGE
jgi:SNF2 family DNA or RNA helicase